VVILIRASHSLALETCSQQHWMAPLGPSIVQCLPPGLQGGVYFISIVVVVVVVVGCCCSEMLCPLPTRSCRSNLYSLDVRGLALLLWDGVTPKSERYYATV
jgi:hypothetical protein